MPLDFLPNTSLLTSVSYPTLQYAWDSTSLGALKTCPRYYQYNILFGYQGKSENIHFIFGIGVHSALESYDRSRAQGATHQEALHETIRFIIQYSWNFERNRPWISEDSYKNRETLIRAVVWYLDHFENDELETLILEDGKPAVELSFRFETGLHAPDETEYLLCGHLDVVKVWNDRLWILDRKTTRSALDKDSRFFSRYSPDNQMTIYYIAGNLIFENKIRGIIIDAIQTGASFTRFQRGQIYRSQSQLAEWLEDFSFWLKQAEEFARTGYYPMNDKSCDKYGGCPYREVCSASPDARPDLLNGLFTQRTWDPLVTREP
jgi:hypothetical protein